MMEENQFSTMAWRWSIALVLLLLSFGSPVNYTGCDSWGSLLTSQAILQRGTIDLNGYPRNVEELGYRVKDDEGRACYYFPTGPSILAMPAVWAANGVGLSMTRRQDDVLVQRVLATVLFVAIFLVLCRIFESGMTGGWATATALIFTLGTGIASTVSRAYWNQGPALFLVLAALMLVLGERRTVGRIFWAGLLAGLAFWCRPTAALGIVCLAILPQIRCRRLLWAYGLGVAAVLLAFAAFSIQYFGELVPPYFRGSRLGAVSFEAMAGVLVSPSRGLLIVSPFLIPLLCVVPWALRRNGQRLPILLALGWIGALVVSLSRFEHWWGGHCFGSRFMVDSLPAFILLAVSLNPIMKEWPKGRRLVLGAVLVLALPSMGINTVKGVFTKETAIWNGIPNIDRHPERIWSWSSRQWAADHRTVLAYRTSEKRKAGMPILPDTVSASSGDAVFYGWNGCEHSKSGSESWRWARNSQASVAWVHGHTTRPDSLRLVLNAKAPHEVEVLLNGVKVGEAWREGWPRSETSFAVTEEAWKSRLWEGHDPAELSVLTIRRPWPQRWYRQASLGFWEAGYRSAEVTP